MVIANAAAIVRDSALVVVAPTPSVTRTVKENVLAAVGVPLRTPALVMGLIPGGSPPPTIAQVRVPVPPDATIV